MIANKMIANKMIGNKMITKGMITRKLVASERRGNRCLIALGKTLLGKALPVSLVLLATAGCSVWSGPESDAENQPILPAPAEAPAQLDARPFDINHLPLAVLVLQRQQLCLIPTPERRQLLDAYREVFVDQSAGLETLPAILPEPIHQLNALMLASCDPARTPGIFSEMLAVVTDGEWSADYLAFFDLLIASHRSFVAVDQRYRELADQFENLQAEHQTLRQQYRALEQELEATIQGISDIERGIDSSDNTNTD